MKPIKNLTRCLPAVLLLCLTAGAQPASVLTYHNDNARTGQNTNETILTLANVNTNTFDLLFACPVDGAILAQPLYAPGVAITNNGTHNVVFVATENDSVYGFDADSGGPPLWRASLINPAAGITTVPSADLGLSSNGEPYGITGTPVIDPNSSTLYVEARTKEVTGVTTNYPHRLHALDLGSGVEKFGGPVVIQPVVSGTGQDNDGNGHVPFNGLRENNRSGLLLADGVVYVTYASLGDIPPYHGWVIGFNAATLQPLGVFNSTPNGSFGGFWGGGAGPATDDTGNLYLVSGNGTFDANTNGDFGDSYIRLTPSGTNLSLADYFTPYNQVYLSSNDLDVGGGGLVVLPDSVGSAAHPHLTVCAGKDGIIHLLDRDNFGQFNPTNNNQIVQSFAPFPNQVITTPACFNNALYYIARDDGPKAFPFSGGALDQIPSSTNSAIFPHGATPSISAHGTNNGIVWALQQFVAPAPVVLHAFNAANLASELYNSAGGLHPAVGVWSPFSVPSVANGKVYVGSLSALSVFGLVHAPPRIIPDGGVFTNQITVTLALPSNSPSGQICYTLDGTSPTTNSPAYRTPFTLDRTTIVKAVAAGTNAGPSLVTAALFITTGASNSVAGFDDDGSGWALNGDATVTNNLLTLTDGLEPEARSAFFANPQFIDAFQAQFVYQAIGQADGAAFVIQNSAEGTEALGVDQSGLGYYPIAQSVAIELNICNCTGGTGTLLGTNGGVGYLTGYASTLPVNLGSGNPIWVTLNYDGSNLAENLLDLVTGAVYRASYAVDISATVRARTAFIGFTGSDGDEGLSSMQTISDFAFSGIDLQLGSPFISPDGGSFGDFVAINFSFQTNTPEGQIFYTLDGKTPTTNSILYTGSLTLSNTTIVKAIATASGKINSVPSEAIFVATQPSNSLVGFGNTGFDWTLNGGTVVTNDVLTLTDGAQPEARSVFFDTEQAIGQFHAQFLYQATGKADGAAFVLQNAASGAATLGANQSGLGYHGVAPSAAIELNICSCTGGTGTLYATNGITGYPGGYVSTLPVNLGSGDPILVSLNYDGATLAEVIIDIVTAATFTTNFPANITAAVGGQPTAFVGFTASDGDAHLASTQTITDFTFGSTSSFPGLSAALAGNQIAVSWPPWALNYALEFATNLTPAAVWRASPTAPAYSAGRATLTLPLGETNTFFRLIAP